MAVQMGKDLLLRIADGGGYVAVAGLRATRISFNAETVDVTHAGSSGRWRELLAGAGVRAASVSGSGVFLDAGSDAAMRAAFFAGATPGFQIVVPGFGTLQGPFQISGLEYSGRHDGEAVYEISLASAGPIAFEAA